MLMSRRQFAESLVAGAAMATLPRRRARAAVAPPRRVIIINTLGTVTDAVWTPRSAPGQAPALQAIHQPLTPYLDTLVLADGLTFTANPTEGHTSPQTLTGMSYANVFGAGVSIDRFIAARLAAQTRLPALTLGWLASGSNQFWSQGQIVPPIDSPLNAWQTAFGSGAPTTTASGPAMPRKAILDLVAKQVKALQGRVGAEARLRLDEHLASIQQVVTSMQTPTTGTCVVPAQPTVTAGQVEDQSQSSAILGAHAKLIVSALSCDITRVVGVQIGTSGSQVLLDGTPVDEHGTCHSYADSPTVAANLVRCETYLSQWFADLLGALKAAPDPLTPGATLLDNTLLVWTRDLSEGFSSHTQYNIPNVLAGGKGYLATAAGGVYRSFGGLDAWPGSPAIPNRSSVRVAGQPHQRLWLNVCEFMGVGDYARFGTVSALPTSQQLPLPELRV
jgi:hypothetical protein